MMCFHRSDFNPGSGFQNFVMVREAHIRLTGKNIKELSRTAVIVSVLRRSGRHSLHNNAQIIAFDEMPSVASILP